MTWNRRDVVKLSSLAALAGLTPVGKAYAQSRATAQPADHVIRIENGLVELAPGQIISTTTYSRQFPGPLLRLTEGQKVTGDIHNDTDTPEQLHWHGQFLPADVDGAAEEGTPYIPAHGMRRISFTPRPAGLRFYHTHISAGADKTKGLYTAQARPVYIEPKTSPDGMTGKLSSLSRSLNQFSAGAATWPWISWRPPRRTRTWRRRANAP